MGDLFEQIKEKLSGLMSNLDVKKRNLLIGLSLFFVIAITAAILLLSSEDYVVLSQGLSVNEAAEIDSKLTELKIEHKDQDASTILVKKEDLSRAKMSLAIEGVGGEQDITWTDAFSQSNISMTSAEKSQLYLQAQATGLGDAIESIDIIEKARVILYVPDDSVFLFDDNMESRVSCVIRTKNGAELNEAQINGIQMILMTTVKGLSKEYISIVDTRTGQELTNLSNYQPGSNGTSQYDLKIEIEERIKYNLVEFLETIYGKRNVKVLPNVRLDFNSEESVSTVFQPPVEGMTDGLIRSMSEVAENVADGAATGIPGTDSNGSTTQYDSSTGSDSNYSKVSKNLNYDLNEIQTKVVKAEGIITDITLAVIINTKALKDEILTEEHKKQVEKLVSASAGLNTKVVEVSASEFFEEEFVEIPSDAEKSSFNMILIVGLALVFAGVIAVVVVFMKKKARVREIELEQKVEEQQEVLDEIKTNEDDASSPKYQINKFIEKNPEAVAQLLRSWINEV